MAKLPALYSKVCCGQDPTHISIIRAVAESGDQSPTYVASIYFV